MRAAPIYSESPYDKRRREQEEARERLRIKKAAMFAQIEAWRKEKLAEIAAYDKCENWGKF